MPRKFARLLSRMDQLRYLLRMEKVGLFSLQQRRLGRGIYKIKRDVERITFFTSVILLH